MATDTKANLAIRFEPAIRRGKSEAWRSQWIRGWEDYSAMIDTLAINRVWRTAQSKVPFEQISLERLGRIIRRRRVRDLGGFAYLSRKIVRSSAYYKK